MKNNRENQLTYRLLFKYYRRDIISVLIILTCLFLFYKIIIPQISDVLAASNEAKIVRDKIDILNKNISYLSSLNDSQLDSQMGTVTFAMPAEKDFEGILGAVEKASIRSGVGIGDYSFIVGDLNPGGEKNSTQAVVAPSIDVSLSLSGGIAETEKFIKELYQLFPLSQVIGVDSVQNSSTVKVSFYYKAFAPSKFDPNSLITSFSKDDLDMLNKVSAWKG